jgi:ABC-type transporter Mla maintaining outer membrane lipid asymmetry permease subunit MlaE
MPLLAAVFSAVGVIGGWIVGVLMIGVDGGAFWGQMQSGVDVWQDLGNGVLKSFVFGLTVTFVALLHGEACGQRKPVHAVLRQAEGSATNQLCCVRCVSLLQR